MSNEPATGDSENIFEDVAYFLKQKGLKTFHLNVNGLIKKLGNVNLLLTKTMRRIDIFGITETHLHENIRDAQLEVAGYTFVRNDRKTGPNGRVGCYIRDGIG